MKGALDLVVGPASTRTSAMEMKAVMGVLSPRELRLGGELGRKPVNLEPAQ